MKLSEAISILSPKTSEKTLCDIELKEGKRAVEEYVCIAQRVASVIVNGFIKDKTNTEKYPELFLNNKIIHNIKIDMSLTSELLTKDTFLQTVVNLRQKHSQNEVVDIINGCLELACEAMTIEIRKQKEGKI